MVVILRLLSKDQMQTLTSSQLKTFAQYRIGTVVHDFDKGNYHGIGHVTGFSTNSFGPADWGEYIIIVKWADGVENPIHPSNVDLA